MFITINTNKQIMFTIMNTSAEAKNSSHSTIGGNSRSQANFYEVILSDGTKNPAVRSCTNQFFHYIYNYPTKRLG